MHDRQPEALRQFALGQREFERVPASQANHVEALANLAEQMRHSGHRRSLPKRKDHLPADRRIDIRHQPIDPRKVRMPLAHLRYPFVRDDGHRAVGDRHNIVVQALEGVAMEIGEVSGDVDFQDLAFSARQILRPEQPALQKENARFQILSRADQGLVGLDPPRF
jgi:hypothetical protein